MESYSPQLFREINPASTNYVSSIRYLYVGEKRYVFGPFGYASLVWIYLAGPSLFAKAVPDQLVRSNLHRTTQALKPPCHVKAESMWGYQLCINQRV